MTERPLDTADRLRERFATARQRLQLGALDIAGLGKRLQETAATDEFDAIRPQVGQIHDASRKLSDVVMALAETGFLDRLVADGDVPAAQSVLRDQLREPIDIIVDSGAALLKVLPGVGGESLRGDLLDILTESTYFMSDIDKAVSVSDEGEDLEGTGGVPDFALRRSATPSAQRARRAATVETGTILVVDDLEFIRKLLTVQLRMEGHRTIAAKNGREALEILAAEAIDLVLLDVMMPGLDGYEVLERIKADEAQRHIPVIMITAYDKMESVIRCIAAGAEDYLLRSCDPVLLRARINACLEQKRWRDTTR